MSSSSATILRPSTLIATFTFLSPWLPPPFEFAFFAGVAAFTAPEHKNMIVVAAMAFVIKRHVIDCPLCMRLASILVPVNQRLFVFWSTQ
ncbi:hypothetical protein EMIT0158MI4_280019 [Burkholderia ambifaria]